jgi:restriction endonuclease S subunit
LRKSELEDLLIPVPPVATQQTIVGLGDNIDQQHEILRVKAELLKDIYNQAIKLEGATK